MNFFLSIGFLPVYLLFLPACSGQSTPKSLSSEKRPVIGGPFENREFMYIGMPEIINSIDTSAGWTQDGQKLLITGTIYQRDGKTPAPDVILYYYHTDIHGYYTSRPELDARVARHGYIRGWVRSDQFGHYSIYTVRPAPYPNNTMPAHIHPTIKEPDIDNAYYIDEFVFDDDVLLTRAKRQTMENRGGSGVLRVKEQGKLQIAEHDIILGLHIPNHPGTERNEASSGKEIGEDVFSFTPYHAWGPDRDTRTCPICQYGQYQGILYFVGNAPAWEKIRVWLRYFEDESAKRGKYLKVYFIYGNEQDYDKEARTKELAKLGKELAIKHVALTLVPSFTDRTSNIYVNRINPNVESTILLYRNRTIVDKFINLLPAPENLQQISNRIDDTQTTYFRLPEPAHP